MGRSAAGRIPRRPRATGPGHLVSAQDPGVIPSQELYSFSAAGDVIASGSPWPEN